MLTVKNISCQKGYNLLFENLSFYLKAGEIIRITGKNGSGKTSLLKILAGINKASSGEVFLGKKLFSSYEYKQEILYLGHQSLLASQLNALENLEFLANLNANCKTNDVVFALTKMGLKNYINELCYQMSAGQKRRVILATLFISKVKIWLLDEPFITLDKESIYIVEKAIKQHCADNGICIFTTHQSSNLDFKEINL